MGWHRGRSAVFSRELRRPLVRAALSVPALALVTTGLVLPVAGRPAGVVDRVTTMTKLVARAGFMTTITEPQVEMVGFEWHGPPAATFEVRARHGGRWSGWTEVASQPSDGPDSRSREHTSST